MSVLSTPSPDDQIDPLDPSALSEHIEATHHRYLHAELPELEALAAKVASVHGDRHPELLDVHRLVSELGADFEPHLQKEERVLFPAIRALCAGSRDFPFGSIGNPIRMMTLEHETTDSLIASLRTAAAGYVVPEDACGSYRSLYERLAHLEVDTERHVHLENDVLFPAVIAVEER